MFYGCTSTKISLYVFSLVKTLPHNLSIPNQLRRYTFSAYFFICDQAAEPYIYVFKIVKIFKIYKIFKKQSSNRAATNDAKSSSLFYILPLPKLLYNAVRSIQRALGRDLMGSNTEKSKVKHR